MGLGLQRARAPSRRTAWCPKARPRRSPRRSKRCRRPQGSRRSSGLPRARGLRGSTPEKAQLTHTRTHTPIRYECVQLLSLGWGFTDGVQVVECRLEVRQRRRVGRQQARRRASKPKREGAVGDAARDVLDFEPTVVAVGGFGVVPGGATPQGAVVPAPTKTKRATETRQGSELATTAGREAATMAHRGQGTSKQTNKQKY